MPEPSSTHPLKTPPLSTTFQKSRDDPPSQCYLQSHFQQRHRQVAPSYWRCLGWVPFAADGSRVKVPRTQANQEVLKCAGKKKTGPQCTERMSIC